MCDKLNAASLHKPLSEDTPAVASIHLIHKPCLQTILLPLIQTGAIRVAGARFSVLKGPLARLERALGQWFLDMHTQVDTFSVYNECSTICTAVSKIISIASITSAKYDSSQHERSTVLDCAIKCITYRALSAGDTVDNVDWACQFASLHFVALHTCVCNTLTLHLLELLCRYTI
jgi:hypothetical protein